MDPPPPPVPLEFFICCSILKRFYLQWKAFDLLNKMRYILWVALLEGLSATQKATARGIGRLRPFRTSRVWSLWSRAFQSSNRKVRFSQQPGRPMVACNQVCNMNARVCTVEDACMPPHWFGSMASRTVGPTWRATTKAYASGDRTKIFVDVSNMGHLPWMMDVSAPRSCCLAQL